ncbi:MAG TPA: hypothetical protein VJH20_04305 [Candidatus Nanoarchaeia archaeon]|nr:hypothetical protein [Candidatus Nanoarchaeia archaeon]
MGLLLELKTSEARFIKDTSRDCHFGIDCACLGKDGKYNGSHYKNTDEGFEETIKNYQSLRSETKYQHTFYLNESLFLNKLYDKHKKSKDQEPLVIVCNDCEREFSFTHESYLDLDTRLKSEYNRRLIEKDKTQ